MSHFPTHHLVTKFDSKRSQPLTGQRLAKIRYKTTEKQSAKYPSVCASVPFIAESDILENIPRLVSHIRNILESAQDGCIRSIYEARDGVLTAVDDSDISIDACIKYLEAEAAGSRMTKEFIESWFDSSVSEYLTVLLAEKLKYENIESLTPEQIATIGNHSKGYKDLYSMLAGGKTILQENQINSLLKVIELIDADETSEKLKKRLLDMKNKPKLRELLDV